MTTRPSPRLLSFSLTYIPDSRRVLLVLLTRLVLQVVLLRLALA